MKKTVNRMKFGIESELQKLLLFLAITAAVLLGIFAAFRLAVLLAPFVIAFILSSFMEPFIRFAESKLKLARKIVVPFVLLLAAAVPGYLSVALISRLIYEVRSIAFILPGILSGLFIQLRKSMDYIAGVYNWPQELTGSLEMLFSNLSATISRLADSVLKGAFATAASLPQILAFILITAVSTYFMANDRELILGFFKKLLPEKWQRGLRKINRDMFSALLGYLKSTMILMCITFAELFAGFSIIHIRYALVLAVLISVIDALPVLGTGSVLLPWSALSFLSGDYRLGTSLLIIFFVILIVRQMVEPKILSRQIGLHPLVTLVTMYVGLELAGFAGLIAGPLVFLLIKSILKGIYGKKAWN